MFVFNGNMEHEQIFQRSLGSKWVLGRKSAFLMREQSKNMSGNKGDGFHYTNPPVEPL